MTLSPKPNERFNLQFSFLDDKYTPFLKQGADLTYHFVGQPLNELISIPRNDFTGVKLEKNIIPVIVDYVYDKFLDKKDFIFIKNSEFVVFAYTLYKINTIILFQVFQFTTEISNEDKETWENFYSIETNACCKQQYARIINDQRGINNSLERDSSELSTTDLDLALKKCIFKKSYVKCKSIVRSHLFNNEDKEMVDLINNTIFNRPVEPQFNFSDTPFSLKFSYGGVDDFSSLTCDLLYDQINFDTTNGEIREHNVKNFISDFLHTCFGFENEIKYFPLGFPFPIITKEQRLLHISMHI